MRKILFFAAAAVAMLASCSQNEDLSSTDVVQKAQDDNAIQFGTYIGKQAQSRALTNGGSTGVITTDGLRTGDHSEGFGVFGYSSPSTSPFTDGEAVTVVPNFMYNQQVAWNNGSWVYSPLKYWPNVTDSNNADGSPSNTAEESPTTTYLNFYAYAPYITTVSTTGITSIPANNATNLTFGYALPATPTADNCVDFLWGLRGNTTGYDLAGGADVGTTNSYNVNLTKQKVDETVDFKFKHALAKIGGSNGLKVVADFDGNGTGSNGFGTKDANTLITVQSIVIKDALSGGESTMYASGKFDISTGTWSNQTKSTASSQVNLVNLTAANINEDIAENFESGYPSATQTDNVVIFILL